MSKHFDYSKRAPWLRAIVLGGHEGLVFTTLLITGVGMVTHDTKAMLLTSFNGLVAGALKVAIAQFVSVYTQVDVMVFQNKRDIIMEMGRGGQQGQVPNPYQVSAAAMLAYLVGGMVPLLAAGFIRDRYFRFWVVMVVASLSMLVLGVIGAALGKTSYAWPCARVLIGVWIAISIMLGQQAIHGYIMGSRVKV